MDINPLKEIKFVEEDIRQKGQDVILPKIQQQPKKGGFLDFALNEEFNKRKLKDYSDVKFTDIYAKVGDESYVAKFPSYDVSGGNQEEYFAQQQTTGEKWKNGSLKFLGQVGTGILGGTAGIFKGLYEGIQTGSFEATYDNEFANYLDDLNKKWDYQLPNYYTQQEKEAGFTDSLTSTNFWAKDVLGGAAFTVSAIGSEAIWAWATGGSSLGTSAARVGAKASRMLGSADDILRAVNKSKTLTTQPIVTTGSKLFKAVEVPTGVVRGLGKTGDLINTARFTYTSAGFEAGFEARHYMREMEDNYYRDFMEKNNGEMPSYEQETEFRKNLQDSANALYGFNLGVVGMSNLATVGKIFKMKSPIDVPSKWVNSKLFGVGVKSTAGELTALTATRGQKIAQNIWGFGKSPIIEGLWEEGLQSVGSNTAKNWVEAGYNPALTRETYDLGQASIDGFAETYGTKEGWKEIGVGMIIGLLTGTGVNLASGRGVAGEFTEAKQEAANLENFSRYYSPKKMSEAIAYANRSQEASKNAEDAEAKGDFTSAELSRKSAVLSQLNFAYNLDYIDETVKETGIAIDNIDNEYLMKEYDVDEKGAEELKQKMKAEYQNTAKEYKKYRDFSEYYVGSNLTKEGLNAHETSNLKQAIAYELTLGSAAYKFSSDILNTIKSKIAGGYSDVELITALDVDNTLLTASREVQAEFEGKKKELQQTTAKKIQLEKEKDSLMKVLLDESQEQKVARVQKLNNVEVELQQLEVERARLEREANATLAAAELNNPYVTERSQQYLTSDQIEMLDRNLDKVSGLADAYKSSDPQKALEVQKLRQEYARSLAAFKRYADLSRQLADPTLGLRGKRNIVAEMRSPKSPNEITVETLEGLSETREKLKVEGAERILASTAVVEDKIEEVQKDAETMEVKPTVEVTTVTVEPTKTPLQAIQEIISKNPYLLSYKGTGVPEKPTAEEIAEYYDLATRALSNPNFDAESIGMSGQLGLFATDENLTEEELSRLKELNQKMSDWQLYSGGVNSENLSINDIIEQQMLLEQNVEAQEETDVTEDELGEMTNPEPKTIEEEKPRPEGVGQTYSRVFVRRLKDGFHISNLGIQKFLDGLDIADKVTVTIKNTTKDIDRSEVGQYSTTGHTFIVTFRDGSEAKVSVEAGGVLKTEDFQALQDNSQYKVDRYAMGKQSGYSLLYDGDAQVVSDFQRIDGSLSYTDVELYNLDMGDMVSFQVNLNDPYNQRILAEKRTEDELAADIKIYIVDGQGNILGDLKANRNIEGSSPEFLELRAEAARKAKEAGAESTITLSKETPIRHMFLGVPNFEFEDGRHKTFNINPDTIVDFGFTQGGRLVLKGDTKGVRKDFISKIMKRDAVPVVVFKKGKYLVAFPIRLIKTSKNLGQQVEQILTQATSPAKAVIEINNLLKDNNLSPKAYNLYYTDVNNQTLFEEDGTFSLGLQKAIADLNTKQDFANPANWDTREQVATEAVINVDLENNPIVSPKPVLDFTSTVEITGDWFQQYQRTGELSEEKATEVANKIAYGETLSVKEYEVSDHPLVEEKVAEIHRIEEEQKKESKDNLEKPCKK